MSVPVISQDKAPAFGFGPEGGSDRFGATMTQLGQALGLRGLGVNLTEVAPGKRAFPRHNHLANDEMFIILEGSGTYRIGDQTVAVKAGDICGAPRGGADTAHQLVNTGDTPLRYYAISTKNEPEIVEYPDSGKFSALAIWPGADFQSRYFGHVGRRADIVDYWDGEDT